MKWFRKSAGDGDADAMGNIGYFYYRAGRSGRITHRQ